MPLDTCSQVARGLFLVFGREIEQSDVRYGFTVWVRGLFGIYKRVFSSQISLRKLALTTNQAHYEHLQNYKVHQIKTNLLSKTCQPIKMGSCGCSSTQACQCGTGCSCDSCAVCRPHQAIELNPPCFKIMYNTSFMKNTNTT